MSEKLPNRKSFRIKQLVGYFTVEEILKKIKRIVGS